MAYGKDKTLLDNNRTLLNLQRAEVENILPSHFSEYYPKLIEILEEYYRWLDSDTNPGGQIRRLYASRDATQVPGHLLEHLEDELLLGKAYFGGFLNKREAVKFSNILYRSKGTKYSIEQFFRAFFGVDPQIIYPKENIFLVGPVVDNRLADVNTSGEQIKTAGSLIGPESSKYLTDDKLYQILAILIRTSIPRSQWEEVYKIFVHPAGMYLGSEILLELINQSWDGFEHDVGRENNGALSTIQLDRGEQIPEFIVLEGIGQLDINIYPSITMLTTGDLSSQPILRQDIDTIYGRRGVYANSLATIDRLSRGYTFRELLTPNSLRFDDSDTGLATGGITTAVDFSQRGYTYNGIAAEISRIANGQSVSHPDYSFLQDTNGYGFQIADINNDGSVTAVDATLVLDYEQGVVTTGPIANWIATHLSHRIAPNILFNTFDQGVFDTQYDSARS